MLKVHYYLNVGEWSVNSTEDPRTEFIDLETSISLDSPSDSCRISVYVPPAAQPGLLEGAAGAGGGALWFGEEEEKTFSVQIRANTVKPGDQITIELTSGDAIDKVMTAEVESINSSFGETKIAGRTGMQKLANAWLNQVYENQSVNQIVSDLVGQAGVNTDQIETGSTYPYFVVHESKNLLKHLRELAMREGMDVYFDTDNKLTMNKFNKSSADHIFRFGKEILDLKLVNHRMPFVHVRADGESPSSNQGPDTWHWIAKDISSFRGEAGNGAKKLAIQDGAVRTKDAADSLASSKLGAIKNTSTWGCLKILGNPKVKLADGIEFKDIPKPELNGLFKVASVRHVLNKNEGYLTYVGFSGAASADQIGGALGSSF